MNFQKAFYIIWVLTLVGCNPKSNDINLSENINLQNSWTIDSLGKFSIESLVDTGFSIKPNIFTVKFKTSRKFKHQLIDVLVCSNINSNGWGKLDSVIFSYRGKKHRFYAINQPFFSPKTLIAIKNEKGFGIRFDDFNFDGHPDLAAFDSEASGNKNLMEQIYIYDSTKNSFRYHKFLSENSNVYADAAKKVVGTFSEGGMSSQIYTQTFYRWNERELIAIKLIDQKYDDALKNFIKTTKELISEKWITQVDTLSWDQLEH